jgi:hypothetical protein
MTRIPSGLTVLGSLAGTLGRPPALPAMAHRGIPTCAKSAELRDHRRALLLAESVLAQSPIQRRDAFRKSHRTTASSPVSTHKRLVSLPLESTQNVPGPPAPTHRADSRGPCGKFGSGNAQLARQAGPPRSQWRRIDIGPASVVPHLSSTGQSQRVSTIKPGGSGSVRQRPSLLPQPPKPASLP